MPEYLGRILSLVTSVEFIVGTLVFGLVLSVVGNALYDGTKQILGRYSTKQRLRNAKEKEFIEEEASKCVANQSYLIVRAGYAEGWFTSTILYVIMGSIIAFTIIVLSIAADPSFWPSLVQLDIADLVSRVTSRPPLHFQLAWTKTEFWFRLYMMAGYIASVYLLIQGARCARRSVNCWKIVTRAKGLLDAQIKATPHTEAKDT